MGARASLGGTKEEEGERKGKKRRRRASVAAFGSKRNSEGVFRGGEDWLPRDHGPVVGVQRAPRDQEGYGQKGPSRSGETKRGERGRGKEGNIAAAAAAAAVAVSAPLRVTLEGAHRRTVAQATGAPVALKFSFFPLAERGIPRNIGGERQRSIERRENVPEMDYPTGSILLGGLVLLRLRWNESNSVSQRPTINASNVPREF